MFEPRLGLGYASGRALDEAKYEMVGFVDDDNGVAPNWVDTVTEVMAKSPDIGVCGGISEGICEVDPPWRFERHKNCYAAGEQAAEAG